VETVKAAQIKILYGTTINYNIGYQLSCDNEDLVWNNEQSFKKNLNYVFIVIYKFENGVF